MKLLLDFLRRLFGFGKEPEPALPSPPPEEPPAEPPASEQPTIPAAPDREAAPEPDTPQTEPPGEPPMSITPRVQLVQCDDRIMSSYDYRRSGKPIPLNGMTATSGACPPDVAEALLKLWEAVRDAGGNLRITELNRPVEVQAEAREKYLRWVNDGKPRPHDPDIHKTAFVSPAGYSWHQAARAIDVDLKSLDFKDIPFDKWLDRLWDLAIPLGWSPIIKAPNESQTEAWHFNFCGPFQRVLDLHGDKEGAQAAALDIGVDAYPRAAEHALQAQIWRVYKGDIGKLDGYIGANTRKALVELGFSEDERDYTKLFDLPSV
jgi:hypothetical protein